MTKISIIVVCLNPGNKLIETIESIQKQTYQDYEVIVKDGFSKDHSIENLKQWLLERGQKMAQKVHIHQIQDKSIYEAMNQAAQLAKGSYFYFLNCGDHFYHADSLKEMMEQIEAHPQEKLFYGNVYDAIRESVVQSNPHIDAFACYRHVPNHQACVYHRSLFEERGYEPNYRVRADYEHFLWCFFEKKVTPIYVPVTLALYEGGGFSETKQNRIRSKEEHKKITALYMTATQRMCYKAVMLLSLQPFRTAMAESKLFGRFYQALKKYLYKPEDRSKRK